MLKQLSLFALLVCAISSCSAPAVQPTSNTPVIDSIAPLNGPRLSPIVIFGSHFGSDSSRIEVFFNGSRVAVDSFSDTRIFLHVPSLSSDTLIITATVNGTNLTVQNTFIVSSEPFIAGTNPGNAAPGSLVEILGSNLGYLWQDAISFNGSTPVSTLGFSNFVSVPSDAKSGPITVTYSGKILQGHPNFIVVRPARFGFTSASFTVSGLVARDDHQDKKWPNGDTVKIDTLNYSSLVRMGAITTLADHGDTARIDFSYSGPTLTQSNSSDTWNVSGFATIDTVHSLIHHLVLSYYYSIWGTLVYQHSYLFDMHDLPITRDAAENITVSLNASQILPAIDLIGYMNYDQYGSRQTPGVQITLRKLLSTTPDATFTLKLMK